VMTTAGRLERMVLYPRPSAEEEAEAADFPVNRDPAIGERCVPFLHRQCIAYCRKFDFARGRITALAVKVSR